VRLLPVGQFQRNGGELRNPFIRAQDQLISATIGSDIGGFAMEKLIPVLLLAVLASKTKTPSRVGDFLFTQISFHVKLTFSAISDPKRYRFVRNVNDTEGVFVTLTTV
jgi:hypothetical protein